MAQLTPMERRYMIFLHDAGIPWRRPCSVQRPSQRKLDEMVAKGLIKVTRKGKSPIQTDYGLTSTGKFILMLDSARHPARRRGRVDA